MKLIFLMLMLSIVAVCGQVITNGVYVKDGETTEVEKEFYSYKDTSTLLFSDGLLVKIAETNSNFIVNSFFQEILNTNTLPEKAKFGSSTLNVSLNEGSAYFVYSEIDTTNSSCVVSTPFADVKLDKGSFYFVVNTNNVLCLVIDGSLTAYGDKKEEKRVDTGNALVVMPIGQGIFDSKYSLSTQFIREHVMNKYKATVKDLSIIPNSTLFIRINGKTVGVTL